MLTLKRLSFSSTRENSRQVGCFLKLRLRTATMESSESKQALILGTGHEYQRHQDKVEASEKARTKFKYRIREIVSERQIELLAEEAGDDKAVWAALNEQQKSDFESFGRLFEGSDVVDEPVQTIAKAVAAECHVLYIDIRSPRSNEMKVSERDVAMCEKILGSLGSKSRVLVIVGGEHQTGVAKLLSEAGFKIDGETFPDSSKHCED